MSAGREAVLFIVVLSVAALTLAAIAAGFIWLMIAWLGSWGGALAIIVMLLGALATAYWAAEQDDKDRRPRP